MCACKHEVKHCKKCDRIYCKKCNKEWESNTYPYSYYNDYEYVTEVTGMRRHDAIAIEKMSCDHK
jgi:hypothetical protein